MSLLIILGQIMVLPAIVAMLADTFGMFSRKGTAS